MKEFKHFTEPTTSYWQDILNEDQLDPSAFPPPWKFGIPVELPGPASQDLDLSKSEGGRDNNGQTRRFVRFLVLPIRSLENGRGEGVASLLVNQAALSVVEELGRLLAERVRKFAADVMIGLPTGGLTLAPIVARALGQDRYVPMGYSRKFWYTDGLSASVSSITSHAVKKVYLDPHQVPLVKGKRVVIIDDTVSSGGTLKTIWDMLEAIGCEVVGCGVVMRQGDKWEEFLGADRTSKLVYVLESPLLVAVEGGWVKRTREIV